MKFWHNIRVPKKENGADTDCVECRDDTIPIKGPTIIYLSGVLSVDEGMPDDPEKWPLIVHKYFDPLLPYFDFGRGHLVKELKDPDRATKSAAGVISMVDKLLGFYYRQNVEDSARPLVEDASSKPVNEGKRGVKIYATSYPNTKEMMEDHEETQKDPEHFFGKEAQEIVRRIFLPILATDIKSAGTAKSWEIEGKKKDVESVTEAFSNITLAGNSYGSSMLIQVENALNYSMAKLGYAEAEQQVIMKSVCALMMGNISPFKDVKTGGRFRSVFIEGVNDKVSESFNPRRVKTGADVDEPTPFGQPDIKVLSEPRFKFAKRKIEENTDFYIRASHSNPRHFFKMNPCGEDRILVLTDVNAEVAGWKERNPLFDYVWIDGDHTGHHVANYTMRGEPYSILPDLVERVMRNAVMRKENPVPSMQDFFRQASLWPEMHGAALNIDRIREGKLTQMIDVQFKGAEPVTEHKLRIKPRPTSYVGL